MWWLGLGLSLLGLSPCLLLPLARLFLRKLRQRRRSRQRSSSETMPRPPRLQLNKSYSGTVTAAGTLTIRIQPPGIIMWNVGQVSIDMPTAPSGSVCVVRLNGTSLTPMVSQRYVAAGDPAILLQPGHVLTLEWTGCTPGDLGKVLAILDEVEFPP